jgi:hypothetical protein
MKPAKALCAALVAALLSMAALGASSASADVLCKSQPNVENECSAPYLIPTTIKAHTAVAKFNMEGIVKCESDLKGETSENLGVGKGLKGKLPTMSFPSCTGVCGSAAAEGTNYKFVILSEGQNGTIGFSEGEGMGVPRIKFANCFTENLTCIYGAASIPFLFRSSTNIFTAARIEIPFGNSAQLMRQNGSAGACAATAQWEETNYEVSAPLPVWTAKS